MKQKLIAAALMAILAAACSPPKASQPTQVFFSLTKFVTSQTDLLTQNKTKKATKIVQLNELTDTLQNATIDWKQELQALASADINKPAFVSNYKTTRSTQNDLETTSYTALKPSLNTQKLTVVRQKDQVISVEIQTLIENPLYTSSKKITYLPLKALKTEGTQSLFYGKKTQFSSQITIQ